MCSFWMDALTIDNKRLKGCYDEKMGIMVR